MHRRSQGQALSLGLALVTHLGLNISSSNKGVKEPPAGLNYLHISS